MASVLLVFQNGQPRIWMTMSRDGLLPKKFAAIHPTYKTPAFSTIITGILVAVPALFMNLKEVTDLSSIGTLFAFVVVCAGVLRMESHKQTHKSGFRVPYVNGKWIIPSLSIAGAISLAIFRNDAFNNYFTLDNTWPHKLPFAAFLILVVVMNLLTFKNNYSLIPVLGLFGNFYLMTELGLSNWIGFGVWLILGLFIYFFYGTKNSLLAKNAN